MLSAQDGSKHELSVNLFGGVPSMSYKAESGEVKGGMNIGGGIGYAYKFDENWAIVSGLDFSLHGAKYELKDYNGAFSANGDNFTYNIKDYEESQSLFLLSLPIMARYSLPVGDNSLRFALGVKLGLPLGHSYKMAKSSHSTKTAHLGYENVDYNFDNIPNGSGKLSDPVNVGETTGKYDASFSVQLAVEAGYRFKLSETMGLSAGLYFNYGLNNIKSKDDGELVSYSLDNRDLSSSAPKFEYLNSVLNTKLTSSLRPLSFGLKLILDFDFFHK
jgi:hypothetical protein